MMSIVTIVIIVIKRAMVLSMAIIMLCKFIIMVARIFRSTVMIVMGLQSMTIIIVAVIVTRSMGKIYLDVSAKPVICQSFPTVALTKNILSSIHMQRNVSAWMPF